MGGRICTAVGATSGGQPKCTAVWYSFYSGRAVKFSLPWTPSGGLSTPNFAKMVVTRSRKRPDTEAGAEALAEEGPGAARPEQEGQQAGEGVKEGEAGGGKHQRGEAEGAGEGPATTEPATKRALRTSEEEAGEGGEWPVLLPLSGASCFRDSQSDG